MKTIRVTTTNPYTNLALEEYLLKEKPLQQDLFFLWRNEPCVVVGRNQNPFNEVNLLYAEEHHIPVLRRISGGGTVYHDQGNINFTYITNKVSQRLNNYRFFLQPIIDILQNIGINATFVKTSHIYIDSNKISGNAQSFHKDRMLHHGTLLYDGDLTTLRELLKPVKRYQTHSVDSTRSHTTNLKDQLPFETDISSFMQFLLEEMLLEAVEQNTIELTKKDHERIEELAQSRYHKDDWNYGETPSFQINVTLDNEVIQMLIVKGRIEESSIFPDELEGRYFLPAAIRHALPSSYGTQLLLDTLFN